MKLNKKAITGLTGPQVVAVIVFLLIVFGVIYLAVIGPFFGKAPSKFGDQACKANAALDNAVTGPEENLHPIQLWFCREREVEISGNNWNACDPDGSKGWEENGDQKSCASYQIAELAMRCWDMHGQNKWDLGAGNWDYDCFKIKVENIGKAEIDEKDITKQLDCNLLPNNDCNPNPLDDGGCGNCGSKDRLYWEWHWNHCKIDKGDNDRDGWTIKYHDHVKGKEESWGSYLLGAVGVIKEFFDKEISHDMINFQEVADSGTCHDPY